MGVASSSWVLAWHSLSLPGRVCCLPVALLGAKSAAALIYGAAATLILLLANRRTDEGPSQMNPAVAAIELQIAIDGCEREWPALATSFPRCERP